MALRIIVTYWHRGSHAPDGLSGHPYPIISHPSGGQRRVSVGLAHTLRHEWPPGAEYY